MLGFSRGMRRGMNKKEISHAHWAKEEIALWGGELRAGARLRKRTLKRK